MILFLQNIIQAVFIALLALPLPLLLVYYPLHKLYAFTMKRKYVHILKKYHVNPRNLNEEQLHGIFPDKKPQELHRIAEFLEHGKH